MWKPMNDAPRGGGKHIIGRTNWNQHWVIVYDAREGAWRHGHGSFNVADDNYFKGWIDYHGVELWPYQSAAE